MLEGAKDEGMKGWGFGVIRVGRRWNGERKVQAKGELWRGGKKFGPSVGPDSGGVEFEQMRYLPIKSNSSSGLGASRDAKGSRVPKKANLNGDEPFLGLKKKFAIPWRKCGLFLFLFQTQENTTSF